MLDYNQFFHRLPSDLQNGDWWIEHGRIHYRVLINEPDLQSAFVELLRTARPTPYTAVLVHQRIVDVIIPHLLTADQTTQLIEVLRAAFVQLHLMGVRP